MPNTYTQVHIHAVFAVQNRISLIQRSWRDELFKYISGIIQKNGHKLIAIDGMPDHVHVFFGMRPAQSLSDLMQDIKGDSSRWINSMRFIKGRFSWQEGYGAFSYSKSHVKNVIEYIKNQEIHHRKISFIEEYIDFLVKYEVPYDDRYIFKPIDYKES
jgi:putative transposase